MKKLFTLIALCLGMSTGAWADNVTLSPTDDTYIQTESGDANNGSATALQCGIWQEQWTSSSPGIKVYNTGHLALIKFNVNDYKGKITAATLKLTGNNPSTNTNSRSLYLGYCDHSNWSEATATYNNAGIITRDPNNLNIHPFNFSQSIARGTSAEISYSGAALVNLLNEGADANGNVTIIVYGLGQECSVNSKEATTGKPSLELTYSNATLYTATFTETSGKTPTITVYSDEARTTPILASALSASTTYYYTAVLAGCQDYNGSFAVTNENPTVNFTMTVKPRFTFTVNAIDANGVVKALYTDNEAYDGKANIAVVAPKYITDNNNKVTHVKNDESYWNSYTASQANPTVEMAYTPFVGDAYFVEIENAVNATNVESGNYSSNKATRGIASAKQVFTVPETGIYSLTYAICNNNVNYDVEAFFYKNNESNTIAASGNIKTISVNKIKTEGIKTESNILLSENDKILIKGSSTNLIFDYILLTKTADLPTTVPVTISAAGYATFVTPYAVDFTDNAIEAYAVSAVNANTVTLTKVTTVPEGQAVIVKGTTGNVDVVANAGSITNLMMAAAADIAYDSKATNTNYVLAKVEGNVGLYPVNSGTIAKGKGYLPVSKEVAAKGGFTFVTDNVTAVEVAEAAPAAVKNGKFATAEGIVIVKDGVKYNVAGMKK